MVDVLDTQNVMLRVEKIEPPKTIHHDSKLEKTKDHTRFQSHDTNRDLDESHVKDLMEKMKKTNLLFANPIKVDEGYKVIDGQHRLEAAKRLGYEVYFIKDFRLKERDMIMLNSTQKVWTLNDYMHFYLTKKSLEYIKLDNFMKENGISLQLAIALCDQWRSSKAMARFRDGDFVFNDAFGKDLIEKANGVIELIKNRIGFKPFLKSTSFFKAICVMLSTSSIDHEMFFTKVNMQLPKIGHQTSVKLYIDMFLEIYNYKMKAGKVSLDEIEI